MRRDARQDGPQSIEVTEHGLVEIIPVKVGLPATRLPSVLGSHRRTVAPRQGKSSPSSLRRWRPCKAGGGRGGAAAAAAAAAAQVNANLKADTTEELLGRKKSMHMTAFRYRIDEIFEKLQARPSPSPGPPLPLRCVQIDCSAPVEALGWSLPSHPARCTRRQAVESLQSQSDRRTAGRNWSRMVLGTGGSWRTRPPRRTA